MNTNRSIKKIINQAMHELGKSVATLSPERHANFLKVYANYPHFMMGFRAELRRLKQESKQ
jgi:hypothetical protein